LRNEDETKAQLITPALHAVGWREEFMRRERYFTDGRIYLIADRPRRRERKRYDYLLCYASVVPLAVVEAKEESAGSGDGMQQAKEYAAALDVPFAYSTNGHGIEEFDFSTNHQQTVERFPSPTELWQRYQSAQKGDGGRVAEARAAYGGKSALFYPYHHEPGGKVLRYYQEMAVCRAIEAILRGQRRILLTMATGSGKTLVAFQIVWKLVKSQHLRRVLYLADRNVLRDQAYNTFAPFEDARALIEEGKAATTRDIYFSIYQAMYGGEEDTPALLGRCPSRHDGHSQKG
jgi:type I restriction enzyme R subunit